MFQLTKDRVLVKLHESDARSRSGRIIIPMEARGDSYLATVRAVGPQQYEVRPGDTIVVSNVSGIEVKFDGEDFLVLDHYEIMAIVEDDNFWSTDHAHQWQPVAVVEYFECLCGATHRVVKE